MEYQEFEAGEGLKLWMPPGAEKHRQLTREEQAFRDALDNHLDHSPRDSHCWMYTATKCPHPPKVWVHEVQFDYKEDSASHNFAQMTSARLSGSRPGFCRGCIRFANMLAEKVFLVDPATEWGMRPRRWHVVFSDGSVESGLVGELVPDLPAPKGKVGRYE